MGHGISTTRLRRALPLELGLTGTTARPARTSTLVQEVVPGKNERQIGHGQICQRSPGQRLVEVEMARLGCVPSGHPFRLCAVRASGPHPPVTLAGSLLEQASVKPPGRSAIRQIRPSTCSREAQGAIVSRLPGDKRRPGSVLAQSAASSRLVKLAARRPGPRGSAVSAWRLGDRRATDGVHGAVRGHGRVLPTAWSEGAGEIQWYGTTARARRGSQPTHRLGNKLAL